MVDGAIGRIVRCLDRKERGKSRRGAIVRLIIMRCRVKVRWVSIRFLRRIADSIVIKGGDNQLLDGNSTGNKGWATSERSSRCRGWRRCRRSSSKSRAIGGEELLLNSFNELRATVLCTERRQATFIASNAVDIRGVRKIVDKDINFSGVVKRCRIVGDVRSKLQKIAEELDIAEQVIS